VQQGRFIFNILTFILQMLAEVRQEQKVIHVSIDREQGSKCYIVNWL